jgi:integrase
MIVALRSQVSRLCARAAQGADRIEPRGGGAPFGVGARPKYKAALGVACGVGLRVSDVVALKLSDIRVEQGKGYNDHRYGNFGKDHRRLRLASGGTFRKGRGLAGKLGQSRRYDNTENV